MHLGLLWDIVIILGLATVVVLVCQRLRLPTVVGFLITGVLAGPHGLGLVSDGQGVETLAEVGVVLLLFTIGMEFSFRDLLQVKRAILLGGSLQVGLTIAAGLGMGLLLGREVSKAVFWGFLAALSSTAIVLKWHQEKASLDSPPGRASLAILIYQDLIVIPMMLITPILAGDGPGGQGGWLMAAKGLGVLLALGVMAKWIIPQLLHLVAATRNRELFLITVVLLCFAVAWLTSEAGLSLALGAFVAGLIISESPYSHQAVGNVLPLRDLLTSIFFVSIGMLMNLRTLLEQPGVILLATLAVMLLKTLAGGAASLSLRLPLRVALPVGLGLCQVGEFSFILADHGLKHGLLGRQTHQIFLAVSVITMLLTPVAMTAGGRLGRALAGRPGLGRAPEAPAGASPQLSDHVIVVGFGFNGRNVARACQAAGIPYLVLEMNPRTVRAETAGGEHIVFGDAMNPAVLEHVGVARARVLVCTIADPVATRAIVATAKQQNPRLHLIARTRFVGELAALKQLGADEVIPEEYETGVEIFARVLRNLGIPREEIQRQVAELRAEGYEMLRGEKPQGRLPACDLSPYLIDVQVEKLAIAQGAPAAGRSIGELELRKRHGVTVLALRHQGEILSNPGARTTLRAGDMAIVLGSAEQLGAVRPLFEPAGGPSPS